MKLDYFQDGRFYNGLLSKQTWLHGSSSGVENSVQRSYLYDYDKANRLKSGVFSGQIPENYSVPKITYDANGNVDSLQRFGQTASNTYGVIDDLKYHYSTNSNQLKAIDDNADSSKGFENVAGSTDFTYYADGFQKSDSNKGITNIEYNYLGLIDKVHFGANKRIENTYTADGLKLKTLFIAGSDTLKKEYVGDLIYINDTLRSIWHDEGRVILDPQFIFTSWSDTLGNTYADTTLALNASYQYFINDHLGSPRVVFQKLNDNLFIAQRINYGVTGDIVTLDSTDKNLLTHLFQGKEWLDGFGYDFLTRTYDPYTMRMLQIDGANQFASGYTGMGNNPVSGIDPDGQFVITTAAIIAVVKAAGIGAAIGGAAYTASVATSYGGFDNWRWGQFAGSVGLGAINGALGNLAGTEILSFGKGFGLSLAPQVSFGSEGFALGANFTLGYKAKLFNAGVTAGANVFHSNITGESGVEARLGGGFVFGNNKAGVGLSSMAYLSGEFSQTTSTIGLNVLGTKLRYENDFMFGVPFADGGDRFRTAAISLSYKDFKAGFNLYTGDPGLRNRISDRINGQDTYISGTSNRYRFGAAFVGYKNYRVGANSEKIRHVIQNRLAHDILKPGTPHFQILNNNWSSFYRIGFSNPFSLW